MSAVIPRFKDSVAPGYFNLSSSQSDKTAKIVAWFNAIADLNQNQVNEFDSIIRQWATRDYSGQTINRSPYIAYLLKQWGVEWLQNPDFIVVPLLNYIIRSYSSSTAENLLYFFAYFSASPFFWMLPGSQIVYEAQAPAIFAETLLIFSDSPTLPAQPDNTDYIPREWEAPAGWSQFPSSATYFSRGYLINGETKIAWLPPRSTGISYTTYNVPDLASLPPSPMTGDIAVVKDDGTGDYGAIYYAEMGTDGFLYGLGDYGVGFYGTSGGGGGDGGWFKTTTRNIHQGQIILNTAPPVPSPRAVWAPNPATSPEPIRSTLPPPVDGPSQGYGMYGGLAQLTLQANVITLRIVLTTSGVENLGIIVNLLRRIKPTLNRLVLFYTVDGSPNPPVQLEIFDSGAIV